MRIIISVTAAIFGILIGSPSYAAEDRCLDLGLTRRSTQRFEGTLTFHIFGGPPYNGGVEKGDTPEPTYILKLDSPTCMTGGDFETSSQSFDSIHIFSLAEPEQKTALFRSLRALIGHHVRVEGIGAFNAQTGHHHAPLVLPVAKVEPITGDPSSFYGTGATTVQAFYLSLSAGSGEEAVRFVVPEKRGNGPLSAKAITTFYGNLKKPLELISVTAISDKSYRVRYTFATHSHKTCNGESVVQTVRIGDDNFITSIKALNGC